MKREETYYYVRKVPRDIRAKFGGKEKIVVSLGTQSQREAIGKRPAVDAHWQRQFERARAGAPLTGAEIAEAAREVYLSAVDHMEKQARAGFAPTATPEPPPPGEDPEPYAAEIAALDVALVQYAEALEASDHRITLGLDEEGDPRNLVRHSLVAADLKAIERRMKVKLEPGIDPDKYRLLAQAVLTANMDAIADRIRTLRGQSPASASHVAPRAPVLPRPIIRDGIGFSAVADAFLAEMQRDPATRLTDSSRRQYMKAFRLFADFNHNAPLVTVDRKMASSFLDTVATLDPKWGQSPKTTDLPLSELLKRYGRGEGQLSNATLNHYVSALKSLFDWARKRGDFERDNPFAEQSRKAGDNKWLPYTMAEVATLFDAMPAGTLRWVTTVGLWSGMRLEEICQVRTSDVKQEAGVWFIDITKAKTPAGIRRVPVHSKLIGAGFLSLAKDTAEVMLWPTLKRSGGDDKLSVYLGKQFTMTRRRAGIERPRVSFHSLRKNFTTALDQAAVAQADAAMLLGHARGFSFDRYSGGPGLKRLRDVMERVAYPALERLFGELKLT
jgi:integrase